MKPAVVGRVKWVGHEFDKLAENTAYARNVAGIYWRSDAIEGLRFGEAVAIEVL